MAERYFQHTFENGFTLLAEQMPGMQSAAMTLLLPAGASHDPEGKSGAATVLSDLALRGAGSRNSRQLTDYLDLLGLQRSGSVGVYHTRFGCAALREKVMQGLPIYGDIIQRAHLPPDGFEAARDLSIQSLEGLEDEPRQKLLVKLREWYFPWPYGRNSMGSLPDLQDLTLEDCKAFYARQYVAGGAILSVAGNVDFKELTDRAFQTFGALPPGNQGAASTRPPAGNRHHEMQASEQTHIGIAYPSIEETDPDYYVMRMAIEVLSGGMSGRLFTEVREKRALCYSVWAGYSSMKGSGCVLGYAGTSNERAQATLDCMVNELRRLSQGITADELTRAQIGLKASTIMQGESTSARAGALAHDWFMRGRLRTLAEIKAKIDAVTVDRVNQWLERHPAGPFTIVTVGPKPLDLPG